MPVTSFFCPSFFRPTVTPVFDPALQKVSRAIYFSGRADGLQGLEAMAHIISNRMNDRAFPSDAVGVVSMGGDLLQHASRQPMPTAPGTAEKQLLVCAKNMAAQLVFPPHRLSCQDPTGGSLDSNWQAASAPGGSSFVSSNLSPRGSDRSDELSDADELSVPPASPRPVIPIRSRKPFFLREQNIAGVNKRPYVHGDATPSTGGSSSFGSPSSGSSGESTRSNASDTPPPVHAVDQPARSTTPTPLGPPSSSMTNLSSTFSANGPSATPGSRLRAGRGLQTAAAMQLGPMESDGYRDMLLPCGLYQDEVIALMYRDITPEDFTQLGKLDERVPKRNTAQRNLVNRLPRVPAKDCEATECSVCLAAFASYQTVVKLPCAHAFHHACISKWLTQCKNTCPLCSAPITSEASASAATSGASASTAASASSCMRTL